MIFAIASNAQASSFDCGKTQPNGLSQSCSVNMRNSVLVADPSIRKIEPLSRDIPVRIGCIVGSEPVETWKPFEKHIIITEAKCFTMLAQKSVWLYQMHW